MPTDQNVGGRWLTDMTWKAIGMATMDELLSLSHRHRQRRCKIAEALREYDDDGRTVIESALERDDVTDDAIRKVMQNDNIAAMADARGPQSVTYHRSKRCICFTEQS